MKMMEKFDQYLSKLPPFQRIVIFLLPALISAALIYLDILPMQEEELDQLIQQNQQLHRDIKRKSPARLRSKIKQSEKKLLALKTKVEADRDDLNFLYAKLSNLEISEFNEEKWALTLDKILKKSLKLDLTLEHIKNSDSETKNPAKNILPKKYVEITGKGSYENAIKYLGFIENRQFLIDIKNIRFEKDDASNSVSFNINFTIYGVNL